MLRIDAAGFEAFQLSQYLAGISPYLVACLVGWWLPFVGVCVAASVLGGVDVRIAASVFHEVTKSSAADAFLSGYVGWVVGLVALVVGSFLQALFAQAQDGA